MLVKPFKRQRLHADNIYDADQPPRGKTRHEGLTIAVCSGRATSPRTFSRPVDPPPLPDF